jgi:hypothetical protein
MEPDPLSYAKADSHPRSRFVGLHRWLRIAFRRMMGDLMADRVCSSRNMFAVAGYLILI